VVASTGPSGSSHDYGDLMSQPPYGPPPGGWPAPGSGPGQPPYVPPAGQPYPPPGQPAYPPPGWQGPPKPPLYKRPWFIVVAGLFAVGVIGSALGGNDDGAAPAASSSTAEAPATSSAVPTPTPQPVAPPTTPAAPPTTEAAPAGVDFAMPNAVGMDLQTAQNLIQTNGVFLTKSHDLLGSRNQLVDSNWMVCDQNIPAGQQVTGEAEGLIDFGVVKREEACP
jgi:hypothetical protein